MVPAKPVQRMRWGCTVQVQARAWHSTLTSSRRACTAATVVATTGAPCCCCCCVQGILLDGHIMVQGQSISALYHAFWWVLGQRVAAWGAPHARQPAATASGLPGICHC